MESIPILRRLRDSFHSFSSKSRTQEVYHMLCNRFVENIAMSLLYVFQITLFIVELAQSGQDYRKLSFLRLTVNRQLILQVNCVYFFIAAIYYCILMRSVFNVVYSNYIDVPDNYLSVQRKLNKILQNLHDNI